jgi:hypothetical protein
LTDRRDPTVPEQEAPEQQPPELSELLDTLDFSGYIVTTQGYRGARVVGNDVTAGPFEYATGDQIDELHHRLAEAAGERRDNHETYVVRTTRAVYTGEFQAKLCLWFYDWKLTVGTATQPYH